MADGGFRPAYNVQFATDTKSTAIAGVSVDNIGSDMGKMLPMNDALAGQYGTRPRQHLADGGFAKLDDIEALAQNGVETFVPVPGNQRPKRVRPPGAVVLQVDPQSAAERAGLKPGDLVTVANSARASGCAVGIAARTLCISQYAAVWNTSRT
jgi:hypothetical protein